MQSLAKDVYPLGTKMVCSHSCGYRTTWSFGIVSGHTPATVTVQKVERSVTNQHSSPVDSHRDVAPDWDNLTNDVQTFRMWRKENNMLRNGNHSANYEYAKPWNPEAQTRAYHEASYY